jgi:hypothetical protein
MARRHEFGPEGHEYVRRYLESGADFGKRLGALLLEHHDVERGTVWAFARVDGAAEKLAEFETGGVFPKRDPHWNKQADAWLRERAADGARERVPLVEHPYAKPTDGWLQRNPDSPAVFCGDDVYEYYSAEDDELVGRLGGATWGPRVGVIAPVPERGPRSWNRQTLSTDVISYIAAQTVAVMIGAWDDEGWLVWEPDHGHPARPVGTAPAIEARRATS